ncbi:helicase [Marinobacter lutaoensis]|uniref:Helicase n=1 Tax=Marinobacter lutaoensis TaxID=135739 RepID=A0A1V2DQ07_9GAMM|nr:N-6 DNA methylase [Marinobacter lutaoensis]ONF42471.1 helicase [Marinobacter lutaoensis]
MAIPTLTWMNLSSYNLVAQVAQDKNGNSILLLRPINPQEQATVSTRRAELLNDRLTKITDQVGRQRLSTRILQGSINAIVGSMVNTPAKMSVFLKKVFPKATPVEMTVDQIRQFDFIRKKAMKLAEAERVSADAPVNLDALNSALPDGLLVNYRETDQKRGSLVIKVENVMTPLAIVMLDTGLDSLTNEKLWTNHIKEAVSQYFQDRETSDREQIALRQQAIQKIQDSRPLTFWESEILSLENQFLKNWLSKSSLDDQDPTEDATYSLDDLISLRKTLQAKLDAQGQVLDDRLVSRIKQVDQAIAELEADTQDAAASGDGVSLGWDNVQHDDDLSDLGAIGYTVDGEPLFEDERGVRFKQRGGVRLMETVRLIPSASGTKVEPANRNWEWLTFDEAMDDDRDELLLAHRVRAVYNLRYGDLHDEQRSWKGLTIRHDGQTHQVAVRPAKEKGHLHMVTLYVHKPASSSGSPALFSNLLRITETGDDQVLVDQPGRKADRATLKIWASLGLSLPTDAPEDSITLFESIQSELDYEELEETQYGRRNGREDADRAGNDSGSGLAADAEEHADGVSAGGGSRGVPERGGDVAGGDGVDVSTPVADRNESGESDGRSDREPGQRSDTEDGQRATGDQQGPSLHAGLAAQGTTGGGGNGTAARIGGADRAGSDTAAHSGVADRDGDSAGIFGQPAGASETALAQESVAQRSAGGSGGSAAGLSDEADGASGEDRAAVSGAVPGTGGTDRSVAGQPANADSTRAAQQDSGSSVPAGEGADSPADATGNRGGTHAGRADRGDRERDEPVVRDEVLESISRDAELEQRTPAQRLKDNLAALRLRAELRNSGQDQPSDEDRAILARYSGFGGIHAQLFGGTYGVPNYVKDANLQFQDFVRDKILTDEEFQQIKRTILNAHYTHSGVIEPMWEALDRMGVDLGRVLEPSCGIGNFRTYMPESVRRKVRSFTGVELDALTADLARLVHKDAHIIHSGFEKTTFPDDFFDTVISNIPFGEYRIYDPSHPERKQTIHHQFFLKALDKVRPGGVVAFVTSRYVLDSRDASVRREIMDRAHVMGVYRLPSQTFDKSTGTQVVTDVVFLQKKGDFQPNYEPLDISSTESVSAEVHGSTLVGEDDSVYKAGDIMPHAGNVNSVFVREPERIIGKLCAVSGPTGPTLSVIGDTEDDIASQKARYAEAFSSLPRNIVDAPRTTVTANDLQKKVEQRAKSMVDLEKLPGTLSISVDGKIMVRELADGDTVLVEETSIPKSMRNRAAAAILAMGALSELLDMEVSGEFDDAILDDRRAEARAAFDRWEAEEQKAKSAFSKKAWRVILNDPRAQRMRFGEVYDEQNRQIERPDILFQRTVRPVNEIPHSAESLEEALSLSLAYTAKVSETYIAELLSREDREVSADDVRKKLVEKGLAFVDPVTGNLVERAVYLSGNLRPKIDACEAVVKTAPEFQVNLDALNAALPEPLTASQIKVGIDAFWLPQDVLEQFMREEMGIVTTGNWGVEPYFDEHKRHWRLRPSASSGAPSLAAIARNQEQVLKSRWGTKRRHGLDLLDNLFTQTIPKVMDPIPGTDPTRYEINVEESLKAQSKAEEIADTFRNWVFKDPERTQRLVDIYNHRFNTTVLYEPDGSHMTFPGMAESWVPRKHQADFIWRAVSGPNAMTAHRVGAGKTLQLISTAIRGKQLGRWNKPMVVVPNHMLEQFCNDAQGIYPSAKVLMMSAADARADNRASFATKIAMGDWDLVVCTHSVFEKISVPQQFEAEIIAEEIHRLEMAMMASQDDNQKRGARPKEIEKAKARLEERLQRTLDQIKKGSENVLNMKEIGIDWIGVDEAHYYKNLAPDTAQEIPGLSRSESKRAVNMLIKCQYLNKLHDGPFGVVMATGTPISNSIAELYTFTRMLRPDLLLESGIHNFNDWMGLFAEVKHGLEIKPEGGGYQMKSRLSRFKNLPELVKMVRTFIDVKTAEDLNLPTPEIEHHQAVCEQTEFMRLFMKYIEARAKTVRSRDEGPAPAQILAREIRTALHRANDKTASINSEDDVETISEDQVSQDILLTIATDGRKAALDPRLIHPKFEDHPSSKVNKLISNLLEMYRKYDADKALQLVFCDFSSPTGKGIFNVYQDVKDKLIAAGIPEDEIAFIHDAKTDKAKEDLFAACRRGDVRFLLGSTDKMGVGTNVQERLVAIHQMDPPWKPSSIEQRLGRIERQGNMFDKAHNFVYTTQDSFDLFMWETNDRKLKMINQAMRRPEDCVRELEEDTEPGYEDILAVTTGNPAIREFISVRLELDKLKRMKNSHIDAQADLGNRLIEQEKRIESIEKYLQGKIHERDVVRANTPLGLHVSQPIAGLCEGPMIVVGGIRPLADALEKLCKSAPMYQDTIVGTFGGLPVLMNRQSNKVTLLIKRHDDTKEHLYRIVFEDDLYGKGVHDEPEDHFAEAAKTLVRYVRKIGQSNGVEKTEEALAIAKLNLQKIREDYGRPFAYEAELESCKKRFENLSAQVGDALSEKGQLDPAPLVAFAKEIVRQTGNYHYLLDIAQETMPKSGALIVDANGLPTNDDEDLLGFIDDEKDDHEQIMRTG